MGQKSRLLAGKGKEREMTRTTKEKREKKRKKRKMILNLLGNDEEPERRLSRTYILVCRYIRSLRPHLDIRLSSVHCFM